MNERGAAVAYLDVASCEASGGNDPDAPVVYLIDEADRPTDPAQAGVGCGCTVISLPVADWAENLTPWPAKSPWRGGPDFGGRADETLREVLRAIPRLEADRGLHPARRAICGYSLGGLFSLFAFVRTDLFAACGGLSASVWYEGWVEWLGNLGFDAYGRYAYISVGSREKNARQLILRTVEDRMAACADILRAHGCEVDYVVGPGTHFQHVDERIAASITALDRFLVCHDSDAWQACAEGSRRDAGPRLQ